MAASLAVFGTALGYEGAPTDGSARTTPSDGEGDPRTCSGRLRVVRGGDFASRADVLRAANRGTEQHDKRFDTIGVRCARDAAEPDQLDEEQD